MAVGQKRGQICQRSRDTVSHGQLAGRFPGAGRVGHPHAVVVGAMVETVEKRDLLLAGVPAGGADRIHGRLGSRVAEHHPLGTGARLVQEFR